MLKSKIIKLNFNQTIKQYFTILDNFQIFDILASN